MRFSKGSYILFIIIVIGSSNVFAGNLVIGLPKLEPYATIQDGVATGMYVEILEAAFTDMQIEYIIRIMPPARVYHEFMRGAIDMTISSDKTPDLPEIMHFSAVPLSTDRVTLMRNINTSALVDTVDNLSAKHPVGTIRGLSTRFDLLNAYTVELANSRKQLLKMLNGGRFDFIVAEESITNSFALKHGYPPLCSIYLLEQQSNFVVFSKLRLGNYTKILSMRFDASLQHLMQRGVWSRILARHKK